MNKRIEECIDSLSEELGICIPLVDYRQVSYIPYGPTSGCESNIFIEVDVCSIIRFAITISKIQIFSVSRNLQPSSIFCIVSQFVAGDSLHIRRKATFGTRYSFVLTWI